ncbi:unnamed protein product [Paramecium pentaurelia]|uniref:Transmembrane protein n=1 Tax=Paramecium pentaurelia TaxID=43138 RepID=A0A8S1WKI2_9CILI|nr:unnamed protein product [Paramecium pentaurelia]
MLIILLLLQLLIVYGIKFYEFNTTLKLGDIKRNISFQQQEYFGIDVLPNEVENFQQLTPINYQESRAIFYLKQIINGSYIGLKNKNQTIYALHKNCTLEIFDQGISTSSQDFKPNCLQFLIDKEQSHLAIMYQDSIILYNIEYDQIYNLEYNYSDAIIDIQLIQKYILISKGVQGLDMLNFQGEIILNNFMANENLLQTSLQANRLLLLFDSGFLIFSFKQAPKLINKILVNECVRFVHNNELFIIQTKTKILEYFWKNLIINQEINTEFQVTSISLYQQQLQFISNGYLQQKLVGIIKDDFNISQIHVSKYQTNSTQIVGYQEKNQLILKQEQSFEIVYWHTIPAFLIFKTDETGIQTCRVNLYQKNSGNPNSTVQTIHYKIYIEVIHDYFDLFQTIIIIFVTFFVLLLLLFIIRRIYLKSKLKDYNQQNIKETQQSNEEKDQEQSIDDNKNQDEGTALNQKI